MRSTRQKRALAAELARTPVFRSARQVHADLVRQGERAGLTTVYNQLRDLADAGEVDVVRAEGGEALYRRCPTDEHHHHLLCRQCARVVEIDDPGVEEWSARFAAAAGFTDVSHTLEIVGTCRDCTGR